MLQKSSAILSQIFKWARRLVSCFWGHLSKWLMSREISHLYFATSLKYHRLHPEYIYQRIERLANMYTLRVLLLMCDVVRRRMQSLGIFDIVHRASISSLSARLQRYMHPWYIQLRISHCPQDLYNQQHDRNGCMDVSSSHSVLIAIGALIYAVLKRLASIFLHSKLMSIGHQTWSKSE